MTNLANINENFIKNYVSDEEKSIDIFNAKKAKSLHIAKIASKNKVKIV